MCLSVPTVAVPPVQARLVQLIDTFNQQIAQVDAELLELVKVEPASPGEASDQYSQQETDELLSSWKATIAFLLTIPGIGILTACWLVVTTLNFTLCETAEAAVNFVGLAPITLQSGTSVRGRSQISRCGHERVRSQLYLATLTAARFNPIIKAYDERLRTAGKTAKVARCACAEPRCCILPLQSRLVNKPLIRSTRLRPRPTRQSRKQPHLQRSEKRAVFLAAIRPTGFLPRKRSGVKESVSGLTPRAAW